MMLLGLLLMLAALFLVIQNLNDQRTAGIESAKALDELSAAMNSDPAGGRSGSSQIEVISTAGEYTAVPEDEETPGPGGDEPAPSETPVPPYIETPEMEMPVIEIGGSTYIGLVEIPALNLRLPVQSEWSYKKLKVSPCRFSGSAYRGNLVIIAHNYVTHFGRIPLLDPDDLVFFTDVDSNRFCFRVSEMEILQPNQSRYLVDSPYPLSLLTCTPGGRTRDTVRCDRIPKGSPEERAALAAYDAWRASGQGIVEGTHAPDADTLGQFD